MSSQFEMLNKLNEKQILLSKDYHHYWEQYSGFHTWQFWLQIVMFVTPLLLIYFKIDRNKALLMGFYGFNIHVWLSYIDRFGTNQGYWGYPYQMIIHLPNSIVLDASLTPVLFMLVYQWTINNKKNYYLYITLLCAFFSFIFKPLLVLHHFFKFYQDANYLYLFIGYIIIMVFSKFITDIFLSFSAKTSNN